MLPRALVVVAIAASLMGCGGGDRHDVTAGHYEVVQIGRVPTLPDHRPTMDLGGSPIVGNGGCNGFSLALGSGDADTEAPATVTATMMACGVPGVMEQERRLFAALDRAVAVTATTGGHAEVIGVDRAVVATLQRAVP